MGFFEDYRRFITKLCLDGHDLAPVRDPRPRYQRMYKEFEYFVNNNWTFDKDDESWEKTIKIETGKFKGKYRLRAEFHEDYPNVPPAIFIKRIGKGPSSSHLHQGVQYSKKWDRKNVCIETPNGGVDSRDNWWKNDMNIATAIKLTLITANGEIDKKRVKRSKLKHYKTTIFGKMEKLKFDRIEFIKYIAEEVNIKELNNTWQWDELAQLFKNADPGDKRIINRYYIKHKPKIEETKKNENTKSTQSN